MPTFRFDDGADPDATPMSGEAAIRYHHTVTANCPGCGRFAKWVGSRHYYNGNYTCYSYDLDCSRCGVQTVECV